MKFIFKFVLEFFAQDRAETKLLALAIFILAIALAISIAAPSLRPFFK